MPQQALLAGLGDLLPEGLGQRPRACSSLSCFLKSTPCHSRQGNSVTRERFVPGHGPVLGWDTLLKCWRQPGRHLLQTVACPHPPSCLLRGEEPSEGLAENTGFQPRESKVAGCGARPGVATRHTALAATETAGLGYRHVPRPTGTYGLATSGAGGPPSSAFGTSRTRLYTAGLRLHLRGSVPTPLPPQVALL